MFHAAHGPSAVSSEGLASNGRSIHTTWTHLLHGEFGSTGSWQRLALDGCNVRYRTTGPAIVSPPRHCYPAKMCSGIAASQACMSSGGCENTRVGNREFMACLGDVTLLFTGAGPKGTGASTVLQQKAYGGW
jgi:hypothetical protein